MRIRLFQYPLPAPPELEDLNAFLASQRVATVTHHVVPGPGGALLVFVVECVGGSAQRTGSPTTPKVDYREELTPEQFARYSRLREMRKEWADAEGVPVYTVFTNAQLAAMVQGPVTSRAGLEAIEGIGAGRLEKYAERITQLPDAACPSARLPASIWETFTLTPSITGCGTPAWHLAISALTMQLIFLGSARASRVGRGALASAGARVESPNGGNSTRSSAGGEGCSRSEPSSLELQFPTRCMRGRMRSPTQLHRHGSDTWTFREMQGPQPRRARRLVEQHGQEVPLVVSQQEEAG